MVAESGLAFGNFPTSGPYYQANFVMSQNICRLRDKGNRMHLAHIPGKPNSYIFDNRITSFSSYSVGVRGLSSKDEEPVEGPLNLNFLPQHVMASLV